MSKNFFGMRIFRDLNQKNNLDIVKNPTEFLSFLHFDKHLKSQSSVGIRWLEQNVFMCSVKKGVLEKTDSSE